MSKKVEKTLWITSIQPENIDGQTYIPTAIAYGDDEYKIGDAALASEGEGNSVVRNFKVDLGDIIPGGSTENRKKFRIANGKEKTAFELSKDFMDVLLAHVEGRFPRSEKTDYKHPAKIIVAEPLSFQVLGDRQDWVANYRANIRRILDRYQEVDFLPEPFAVYQYYRYGQRIPHLQDQSKHIAFIVDFGGGTFDACIIESTAKGDISLTGKHSKPLSADSVPVGGFFLNRELATYLIKRNLEGAQRKLADR